MFSRLLPSTPEKTTLRGDQTVYVITNKDDRSFNAVIEGGRLPLSIVKPAELNLTDEDGRLQISLSISEQKDVASQQIKSFCSLINALNARNSFTKLNYDGVDFFVGQINKFAATVTPELATSDKQKRSTEDRSAGRDIAF